MSKLEEAALARVKNKFLTSYTKWVQSEIAKQVQELAQLKAVNKAKFGINKVADSVAQGHENTLASLLGVV
jgi:hypothetical protein